MRALGDPDEIRRFLGLLARPGDVFELRSLGKDRGRQIITSGYFDDLGALASAAFDRSGKDDGVYITINPVLPALLARAPKNRVRQAGNGDTTSDRDVLRRHHLLVDFDPVRPAGISSTNEEHAAAIALARDVRAVLAEEGWPESLLGDSGNGAHLVYGIDLPCDDEAKQLVERVLKRLHERFSTETIKIDVKVFNAGRISKIYGTLTRKGEDTPERPHRLARILHAPDALVAVPRELLEAFAPTAPKSAPRTRGVYTGPRFDLDSWIAEHLPDRIEKPWSDGRRWLLPVCPFNDQHNRCEAFVQQDHAGVIAAGCKHDSCFSTWRELRELLEPDAYERRTPHRPPQPPDELDEDEAGEGEDEEQNAGSVPGQPKISQATRVVRMARARRVLADAGR